MGFHSTIMNYCIQLEVLVEMFMMLPVSLEKLPLGSMGGMVQTLTKLLSCATTFVFPALHAQLVPM